MAARSRIREERNARRVVHRPMVMELDPVHNRQESLADALGALKEALGEEWATDAPSLLCGYARDQSYMPATYPHIVALPGSTEDVQAVFRIANEFLIDVIPYGTGISTFGCTIPPFGGIVMDLRRMDRIVELDGENMFATVQPGVNFLMLQAAAQRVGCRVLNPSTAATAGVLSNHLFCNINTMSSKYGFGMDNIIDVEAVMPDGTILRTGSCALGSNKGPVQGPGPDMSSMWRYAWGTLGCVTQMTVRLYPEAPFHAQMFPAYEEDKLEVLAAALQEVAQDNLSLELAHLMNSFYGIFMGDNNQEASKVAELMPRHNLLTIFGGETEEEAQLKSDVTRRMLVERYPMFDYLPLEAIEDMTEEYEFVNLDKWVKYFNVTVRVQRVRGSFMIGALIDKLENMVDIEKMMRRTCTYQIGTNEDSLRPDDASTYLQPYHMGRSAYMEYDLYTNQAEKDDLLRCMAAYFNSALRAMSQGMLFAAGPTAVFKGLIPNIDTAITVAFPNMMPIWNAYTEIKKAVDPNNVCFRKWEYEDDCSNKLHLMF